MPAPVQDGLDELAAAMRTRYVATVGERVKDDWPKVDPECRKLATHQRS